MSQQDYLDARADIAESLKEDGFAMTLTQTFTGELDPVTGKMVDAASFDWPVYGIKGSLGRISRYGENDTIMGTTIEAGDVMVILEAGKVVPKSNDILTMNGVKWRVLASDGLDPGGVDMLYQMHVRR